MTPVHRLVGGVAAALVFVAGQVQAQAAPRVTTREGQPSVYSVESGDPAMDAANNRARATLGVFDTFLQPAARGEVFAQLKARFSDGDNGEHMWIRDVRRVDGGYRGILDNVPMEVRLSRGDTVVVTLADVSDWMVVKDGELIGGFTLVEMRRRMTPRQREHHDRESYFLVPADSAVWNVPRN
jgi:uncharacterized protein YegJ (DUF2314 family)